MESDGMFMVFPMCHPGHVSDGRVNFTLFQLLLPAIVPPCRFCATEGVGFMGRVVWFIKNHDFLYKQKVIDE